VVCDEACFFSVAAASRFGKNISSAKQPPTPNAALHLLLYYNWWVHRALLTMVGQIGAAALLALSTKAATAFTTVEPPSVFFTAPFLGHLGHTHSIGPTSPIVCFAASSAGEENESTITIPSYVVSPVLAQVYPALIAHKKKHGNPNIPLGSTDGKRCKTLRRLHFQNMLTENEAALLTDLGFQFHSFEDVYYECDFDEMLFKLTLYYKEFQTYQIPKKYAPDPELG
jgi:hypothetical protein